MEALKGDGVDTPTLAQRLDYLLFTVRPAGRKPYSLEEVARAITDAGTPISAQYLWLLRRGDRTNPTKRHLEGLARFFGVPAAYFLDPEVAEETDSQLGLLAAMRDAQVAGLAVRAAGLSPNSLDAIRALVENARRLEGLPEAPPKPGG